MYMYTFLKCFHKSVKFIFIFKYSNSFLPLAYICLYICFYLFLVNTCHMYSLTVFR